MKAAPVVRSSLLHLCLGLLCLWSAPGVAQSLVRVGRIAPQVGWRYTTNSTFYNRYYSQDENAGKTRSPRSVGGPVIAATFGYSVLEGLELGIDLFATGERLSLNGVPPLSTATYGGLLALRLQTLVEGVGPSGLVLQVGALSGPTLVLAQASGQGKEEIFTQAWGASAGANLRLSEQWSVGLEYRLLFVRGMAGTLGSFNGGGQWLSISLGYSFPPEPERNLGL